MDDCSQIPRAPEAEKQVLGSVLLLPQLMADLTRTLRPADFLCPMARAAFGVMCELHFDGQPLELPMLVDKLRGSNEFVDQPPASFLYELTTLVSTAAHADFYARQMIEARRKRQLFDIGDAITTAALNGKPADTVFNDLLSDVEDFRRDIQPTDARQQFPLVTAAELATAEYAITYLVDRILVKGQPCVLGGPKKALKTTLAINLAISLALERAFLGKFKVNWQWRVLVCSAESGMATIQETALRICESIGATLAEIDNLAFTPNVPKLHDTTSWADFQRTVEDFAPDVMILDPFYRMLTGEGAENVFKMGVPLGRLDDFCQSLGITLVICHHLKTQRLNQFAPADLDDLAYAGLAEFTRQWLLVTRRESYEDGSGFHQLWLRAGGSAGHNSLWALDVNEGSIDDHNGRSWSVDVQRADEAIGKAEQRKAGAESDKQQKRLDDDRAAVCRVLAKYPCGLSQTNIRDHAGISGRRWPVALAAMLERAELVPVSIAIGNKKQPITGYRLNESEVS